MSVVTCSALLAMNMNLMCVSAAILILTALDDRAGATVPTSQTNILIFFCSDALSI